MSKGEQYQQGRSSMTSIIANNQTVSPVVYGIAVREEAKLPEDFVKANAHRIDRAYKAGEPIWMIVAELKMVFQTKPIHKPMKSPRSLAVRVMKIHDETMEALRRS